LAASSSARAFDRRFIGGQAGEERRLTVWWDSSQMGPPPTA
jgi:hypothetical protein